ncbi:CDP-diacylglycerol--glycerol-3-phosphate 3-phosphatidyltransferase [Brevibacterium sp. 50QC2O2]|uniref:CDP-diacylglycerol--glycerol-3-phosphate 3-phosphatidyltransferase n=1 Tax=Brevibacterium TaxID=1696 RepID=UPI00211C7E64|nr:MULTISPECIES: CDP-diacylglycerol--glycerol-3-phosphate 3-phosphatidyltransferase [unclassified Brevibacterium]MCQ9367700.1 CDP-diacylglycerol--glycerol-3-phosphate 3-phosphatidyltransferase [Brevibacterium sp. 91QC2O2]MCQ9384994.1 CDP-diacylglycerol--glycerol-3-phosphate 3-phosphatidyltransferase [Brevibacterium sp. 68QC2CO]MCQ9387959.1 CDP-diacylglycerol--glycerol-3-phosphate 3-phosphatidyltransferase [Brevibacterium sp. 50QC2O2]
MQTKPSNWNVPNALTILRIIMVPIFIVVLLHDGGSDPIWRIWAFVVFVLAMVTDAIDGHVARKYNLITDFGKIADPIADKALTAAAFICLAIVGDMWWVIPVLVLVREFGITLLRFAIITYAVMPASKGGKLKTVLQTVALAMYLLLVPVASLQVGWLTAVFTVVAVIVLTAAVVVTLVSGVDYCVQAYRLVRDAKAAGGGTPEGEQSGADDR